MIAKLKLTLVFTGITFLIIYSNCNLDIEDRARVVKGEGPLVTQVLPADTFKLFQHLALGNVNIITGDSLEVTFKAQQNIIDEMQFEFKDDLFSWFFKEEIFVEDADSILLEIKMPNALEGIQVGGIGNINIKGDKQESFLIDVGGFTEINGFQLEVDNCEIYISGSANIRVKVNDELGGAITGQGNVYYRGDPIVTIALLGNGDVIKDD
jgi:hypothetical protein